MTNLLATTEGRNAATVAQKFLLQRRLSRFFKRNLVISVNKYESGGTFDLPTLLGDLNVVHDDEVIALYRLLGLVGGLSETVADIEVHVNGTTGNDLTGDGSAAAPYQTFWFFDGLPKRVRHKIEIVFSGTVGDGTFDLIFDHVFSGNGSINFIGTGAPTQIAGPFECAAIGAMSDGIGRFVALNIAPGAAYEGKFLHCISGIDAGQATPIHDVPAGLSVALTSPMFLSAVPGDDFNVVEPAPVMSLRSLQGYAVGERQTWPFDYRRNRIVFVNCKIVFSDIQDGEDKFVWRNRCHTQFSFVQAVMSSATPTYAMLSGHVNDGSSIDTDLEALANCGVINLNDAVDGAHSTMAGMSTTVNYTIQTSGEAVIKRISSFGGWTFNKAYASLELCFADYFTVSQSVLEFSQSIGRGQVYGVEPFFGAAFRALRSRMSCYFCTCLISNNIFAFTDNSNGMVGYPSLDPTYSAVRFAIYLEGKVSIDFVGSEADMNALASENGVCLQFYNDALNPGMPWHDSLPIKPVDGLTESIIAPEFSPSVAHTK